MPRWSLLFLGLLAHPACAGAAAVERDGWRDLATPADRERLRHWRDAWMEVPGLARRTDPLFDPDRALPGAEPPAGDYRCRLTRLRPDTADALADDWVACRIDSDGGVIRLRRLAGMQRLDGRLLPDGPTRAVLLGTLMIGDEHRPRGYGQDTRRDVAGILERVGPNRWRLSLPHPGFGGALDLVELVPAAQ